jgi:ATP synthase protein I
MAETGEREKAFARRVGEQEARKLRAQQRVSHTVWSGLGMMGLVGWSVATPTVIGAALGVWLDRHHPARHSWTLTLLVTGLAIGCVTAWHWVSREHRAIRAEQEGASANKDTTQWGEGEGHD